MNVENIVSEKINSLEKILISEVTEFNSKYVYLENELNRLQNILNSEMSLLANEQSQVHEELKKKCEYLKAEIWRYKHLLEDYSKAKAGVEFDQRIIELEEAINEYTDYKISTQLDGQKLQRDNKEVELLKQQNETKVKIDILKDQFEAKINAQINELQTFLKTHISAYKGTVEANELVNFSHANYDRHSSTLNIGSIKKLYDTPIATFNFNIPCIFEFQNSKNILIIYDESSRSKAEAIADTTILRTLSSNLPDKLHLHLYDRLMLEMFSEFLILPPKILSKGSTFETFVSEIEKIENDVRSKLSLVWSDISDGNQSILEYNLKKISIEKYDDIIPYHLFVFDNFQSLITRNTGSDLFERMNNLTRYGCNFILLFRVNNDPNIEWLEFLQNLNENLFQVVDFTGKFKNDIFSSNEFQTANVINEHKKFIIDEFIDELKEVEKNRSKLKFTEFLDNDFNNWFLKSSGSQVKVNIGKSISKNRHEEMSFNTKNDLAHVLLCGGIGSGKTNFLKTIITTISIQYSPEEVELYLIDMKSGAGFSIFETEKLPHAKLFVFSAENELVNDVFLKLKIDMDQRYTEYARYNIDNIEDVYKHPDLKLTAPKRTIVIIDEFASIYTDDDSYHNEISSNILNIAQKGRAMGINLFFATQNFNNIRVSEFRQAMNQFATRIVLKGSPEASASILGTSNYGYKEVTRTGEGLINLNYGEINSDGGNELFKSYLLDNEDLLPILKDIRLKSQEKQFKVSPAHLIDPSKPIIFDTSKLFSTSITSDIVDESFRKLGVHCYLGKSFLIEEANYFSFNWKINGNSLGQNILIAGNEREFTVQALYSIISSLSYNVPYGYFSIKFLNPLDEYYSKDLGFNKLKSFMSNYAYEEFHESDLEMVMAKLKLLLNERKLTKEKQPVIVVIPAIEVFIKFHKNNYDLTSETNDFLELLKNGSNHGIYFVCEINKPSNLSKLANSQEILPYFEHRIGFFMNEDESEILIESRKANKLISVSNQNVRNIGLYYSLSSQASVKFISFTDLINTDKLIHQMDEDRTGFLKLETILPERTENSLTVISAEEKDDIWEQLKNDDTTHYAEYDN